MITHSAKATRTRKEQRGEAGKNLKKGVEEMYGGGPPGAPITVANEAIETLPLVTDKTSKVFSK